MFPAVFSLADLNGKNGFVIKQVHIEEGGYSVSGAGDINGDGIADVIIGAPYYISPGQGYVVFGSKNGFNTTFNLTDLNGNNGFNINGIDGYDDGVPSWSVSGAGDINGDGIADVIIGTPEIGIGKSYIIFGSKGGFTTSLDLAYLNGNNGFVINGINIHDNSGTSVSGVGDVNGDGMADIIIGAPGANAKGQSYVIFGSEGGFTTPFNLNNLNGNNGFAINGININDSSGASVSGAGDVNGDGMADIIIGAPGANIDAGQSYVIFGSKNGFTTPFNLTDLNGNDGFVINGININDSSGASVSGAGDVNGDGIQDIIIGAPGANNNAGQSYVIFGSKNGFNTTFNLADLNGNNGFAINEINRYDQIGNSVSGAGDINGDGIQDIIIGTFGVNSNAGQSYIIYGSKNRFTTPFNLADLNGSNGFIINGIDGYNDGSSVSGVGDVNGDGIADIVISATVLTTIIEIAYVIFGNNETLPTPTPTLLPTVTPTSTQTPEPGVTASSTPTPSASFGASHTSTPTPSASFNPHHENPNSDDHGLSAGAIAGIAVGGAVGLASVIGAVWWHCHKHVSVAGEDSYTELPTKQ